MRKMRTFPTSQDNTPRPLLPTRCPCCVTEPAGTACTGEPLPPDLPMGTPVINYEQGIVLRWATWHHSGAQYPLSPLCPVVGYCGLYPKVS